MQTGAVRSAKIMTRVSVVWGAKCEVRTEINKFGLDPGAKCEMLVKSPDDSQCTSSRCEFLSHHGKYSKYLKY